MNVTDYLSLPSEARKQHLALDEVCVERGGNSTNHRGVLAQYLNTDIFGKPADLCHACHNEKCSNPRHLYWGTRRENIQDAKNNGTWKSPWYHIVEKHGIEKAREINRKNCNPKKAGAGNKGKPKSEEHKKKISDSLRKNAVDKKV